MSNGYKPTTHLRFERRFVPVLGYENTVQERRILQQLWVSCFVGENEEWRDVETVDAK